MDPSPAPVRQRWLTIGRLMIAVAILALGLKSSTTGMGAVNATAALVLLLFAARTILVNPAGSLARRRAVSWTAAGLAVYLPMSEGFFLLDCSHCVGVWAQLWPAVPGAPLTYLFTQYVLGVRPPDYVVLSLSGCIALALIATIAVLGLRGRWWMGICLALGALYSQVAALAISAALRS